ncbi:SLC13 family permease [Rhizobiaceae bacterium]|nr:SLC13 family permease [Rhizobiaceae bacterium]
MEQFHLWATFVVIAATIVGYAWERYSIEAVSLAAIAALLLLFTLVPQSAAEPIEAGDLLMGFANPALITVLALLVIGQALFATDALDRPAELISRLGGASPGRTIFVLLAAALVTSAFLNNTPVVVMFIPIVVAIAAKRNFAASSALMPLSYIGILGGMTTLIGSSTNLLVAGVAERYGYDVGFFDFTALGAILAAIGFVYVIFVMPLLLRERNPDGSADGAVSGRQFLAQVKLDAEHPLIGESAVAGLFPSLAGITVRSVQRDGMPELPPFEDIVLREGDVVIIAATRRALTKALSSGAASLPEMSHEDRNPERETDTLTRVAESFIVAEAVVAPGSRYTGRTIENSKIRATYGTMVLGLQRRSGIARGLVRDVRLEAGDTLLIGGLPDDIERLRLSRELLLLERSASEVPLQRYAPRAIGIFAAVVIAASLGYMPVVAAALVGAYAVIASGCLSIRQATRSFDRQIFMMVGASLAAATALERTGGASLLAEGVVGALDGQSAAVVLSVLFALTAVLTNILSNNATAVLFTPIAIGVAQRLDAPIEPFVVGIIFAANCSFATPVGYQTNLLVLGPGRYRFIDYVKAGVPLMVIIWIAFSLIAPFWYGL